MEENGVIFHNIMIFRGYLFRMDFQAIMRKFSSMMIM